MFRGTAFLKKYYIKVKRNYFHKFYLWVARHFFHKKHEFWLIFLKWELALLFSQPLYFTENIWNYSGYLKYCLCLKFCMLHFVCVHVDILDVVLFLPVDPVFKCTICSIESYTCYLQFYSTPFFTFTITTAITIIFYTCLTTNYSSNCYNYQCYYYYY